LLDIPLETSYLVYVVLTVRERAPSLRAMECSASHRMTNAKRVPQPLPDDGHGLVRPGRSNLFLISSPSRTHLQSSLPVTVFAFARKNGLLVWRVAPELTSVE